MTGESYSYWPTTSNASTNSGAVAGYWPTTSDQTASAKPDFWKDSDGPGFHDLLDAINPLQHLPVIGTIYRWATGDEPGNVARVIGDALYGGPLGAAAGLFNAVTRDSDGEDLGEQVMAWAFGPGHSKAAPDPGTSAIAEAKPAGTAAETTEGAAAPAAITTTELADATPTPPAAETAASSTAALPAAGSTRSVASVAALYRSTEPAAVTATKPADPTAAPVAAEAAASPTAALPAAGSTRSVASVAALYRSTDPATRRAEAPVAMANATPDHAPLPLVRTATAAPAYSVAAADPGADPAHQLSVQNAMLQRQIAAGRSSPASGGPQLVNTPVPLQLTGQILPRHQSQAAPVVQQASISQPAAGVTAPAQTKAANPAAADPVKAPAAPADLAVGTPAEISQKMMNALDKYMRLKQERAAAAGSQIDVSP